MKTLVLSLFTLGLGHLGFCQTDDTNPINNHTITFELSNTVAYGTLSLNYESVDFLKKSDKHIAKFSLGFGRWSSELWESNTGFQFNSNFIYLFGANSHHFEADLGLTYHFDKGLEKSKYAYIGTIPNVFLGYRFQKPEKHFMFKIGAGWYELIQAGIGYSF